MIVRKPNFHHLEFTIKKCVLKVLLIRRQNIQSVVLQNYLVLFQEHQIFVVGSCNISASCPTLNILRFFQTTPLSLNFKQKFINCILHLNLTNLNVFCFVFSSLVV